MRYTIFFAGLIQLALIGCGSKQGEMQMPRESTEDLSTNSASISDYLLIGTYTRKEGHVNGKANGMGIYGLDKSGNTWVKVSEESQPINPSYLTTSYDGKFIYVVNETGPNDDPESADLHSYAFDRERGQTRYLNKQPSHGFAPCYISVNRTNNVLLAVNYMGGAASYPLLKDGTIGEVSTSISFNGSGPHSRQEASHPHSIIFSRSQNFAYIADLGTDQIHFLEINSETAKMTEVNSFSVQPGSGPRHMALHPTRDVLYILNELSNTINVLLLENEEPSKAIQTISTLPGGFSGENTSADIHITADGRFLYSSNRGDNSLAIFSIDKETGNLSVVGHEPTRGEIPRNFLITNSNLLVANQNSDNVVEFRIKDTGMLEFVSIFDQLTPVCLKRIHF